MAQPWYYGVERGVELAHIYRFLSEPELHTWIYTGQQLGKDRAGVRPGDPVVTAAEQAGFDHDVAGVVVSSDLKVAQPAIVMPIEDPPLRAYRRLYTGPHYELWQHVREPACRVLLRFRDPGDAPQWWLFVNGLR